MEFLYNPDRMSEQEIKGTFVAREALLERLVQLIQRQPDGAGVQHVVLVAPRGMGKTTMLLMLRYAVTDRGLDPPWLAVRFPEEMYSITDLGDFWMETLNYVAQEMHDDALAQKIQDVKNRYRDDSQFQEAALSLLRGWCRQTGRRLLLLIDNFQMILSQIDDEQQNAALRAVLMNEGFLMFVGAAPAFFKEADDYDQPLYNFFKIERLERLSFDEILDLLRRRAESDGLADVEAAFLSQTSRLRVLEYFTGGNARLVLMLYRVVAKSEVSEVKRDLEELLDQVTPFYQNKTEALPTQQRKILDYIARTTGKTSEGVSPSEIAEGVRMTPQIVSAQLKRLTDAGYVQPANLRGRSTYYTLSERLYSLWYQMRFGRDQRQKMGWLVEFLQAFYSAEELQHHTRRLEGQFGEALKAGEKRRAEEVLHYRSALIDAINDPFFVKTIWDKLVQDHLMVGNIIRLKEWILPNVRIETLSRDTREQLVAAGCITKEQGAFGHGKTPDELTADLDVSPELWMIMLENFDEIIQLFENDVIAWCGRGHVLGKLGRFEEAIQSFNKAISLNERHASAWHYRGSSLACLRRYEEAIISFDKALSLNADDAMTWHDQGNTLLALWRYDEAVWSYEKAMQTDPRLVSAWNNKGAALLELGCYDRALLSLDSALEINPTHVNAWMNRANALNGLERYEEAIQSYAQALSSPFIDDDMRFRAILCKLTIEITVGQYLQATQDWSEAMVMVRSSPVNASLALEALLEVTKDGHSKLARELMAKSNMEEQFFPLARALDYLATEDAALIEKLTPEMRPIVDQVIARVRSANQSQATVRD